MQRGSAAPVKSVKSEGQVSKGQGKSDKQGRASETVSPAIGERPVEGAERGSVEYLRGRLERAREIERGYVNLLNEKRADPNVSASEVQQWQDRLDNARARAERLERELRDMQKEQDLVDYADELGEIADAQRNKSVESAAPVKSNTQGTGDGESNTDSQKKGTYVGDGGADDEAEIKGTYVGTGGSNANLQNKGTYVGPNASYVSKNEIGPSSTGTPSASDTNKPASESVSQSEINKTTERSVVRPEKQIKRDIQDMQYYLEHYDREYQRVIQENQIARNHGNEEVDTRNAPYLEELLAQMNSMRDTLKGLNQELETRKDGAENNEAVKGNGFEQVIGEQGTTNLDDLEGSDFRRNTLILAKNLQQISYTPEKIRSLTGWEQGIDGKWRYEIPDGKIRFDVSLTKSLGTYKINTPDYKTTLQELYDINLTIKSCSL